MPEIAFIVGARPNFMKVAPLLRAMAKAEPATAATLVHTGQHYSAQMSDVFFEQLGMPAPDVHLGVGSGSHGFQTARVLEAFEQYLLGRNGAMRGVVVVGDVNSTLACALAGVKLGVPVAHVEAGLRSFDRTMPEEINRIATDAISDVLFVSEPAGKRNLDAEGVPADRIEYAGNVMIDTLVHQLPLARELDMPGRMGLEPRRYATVTLHRPANVDHPDKLRPLIDLLLRVAARLKLVFPVHPRSALKLREYGMWEELERGGITLLDPLGYRENLGLVASASFVLTDSGGIQEETTYLNVPCITLRTSTERPVTVQRGTNTVVGEDYEAAYRIACECVEGAGKRAEPIPGWDGFAAVRIVEALAARWN